MTPICHRELRRTCPAALAMSAALLWGAAGCSEKHEPEVQSVFVVPSVTDSIEEVRAARESLEPIQPAMETPADPFVADEPDVTADDEHAEVGGE